MLIKLFLSICFKHWHISSILLEFLFIGFLKSLLHFCFQNQHTYRHFIHYSPVQYIVPRIIMLIKTSLCFEFTLQYHLMLGIMTHLKKISFSLQHPSFEQSISMEGWTEKSGKVIENGATLLSAQYIFSFLIIFKGIAFRVFFSKSKNLWSLYNSELG